MMDRPLLDPPVDDQAPAAATLTLYDEEHLFTYLRLLMAEAEQASWREVAEIVLHIDPIQEPERARAAYDSHLARAHWMRDNGYEHLLRKAAK
jgi:hypothetical protein